MRGFGYVVITIYALACIFPFLLILGSSFTAEEVIRTEGVQLIPKQFTLAAYEMVCKGGGIWKSYLLTIILTVVGTAVATVAVIVGQLGMGMLIDNFGWLGNPAIELSGSRIVAMACLALALVFTYRSNTRAD